MIEKEFGSLEHLSFSPTSAQISNLLKKPVILNFMLIIIVELVDQKTCTSMKFLDLSEIYQLDLKTWHWKKLETDPKTIPPPRNKHGWACKLLQGSAKSSSVGKFFPEWSKFEMRYPCFIRLTSLCRKVKHIAIIFLIIRSDCLQSDYFRIWTNEGKIIVFGGFGPIPLTPESIGGIAPFPYLQASVNLSFKIAN